ncbi:M20/M25/M40 family metallo-hydrolase [Fructobacillus ficulneus]|uniref:Peptidase M20 n=1 Tax=Fructobacillus ficulneus TaxID=157463 RepID=A0A0K8MFJ2_9LACO|nr:M20/M25/M40 family metallo-hydrolase [Fructobacillus ficulneus]GAO99311.1 peptidase M20 [Fructobacillus ficulneus]
MNKDEIADYVQRHSSDFFDYLRFESISTQNKNLPETATWLVEQFKKLGAETATTWHDQGANPVVYASFKGKTDKTVLFYNHYDVQPAEPLDEWLTEPFEPTVKDGKIFGRGVCDDKGELISRLSVLKYYLKHGGLPVNVKFFVEGAEEIGSPKVKEYVEAHQEELASDVCIWEGGGKDENENFQITCGLKGVLSVDLVTETAARDIHSSLAVYAPNAAWRLIDALNSMRDENGKVLIDGFNDDVLELSPATKKLVDEMEFNAKKAVENAGINQPLVTDQPNYDLINGTTMTINGLSAGYEGAGVKTIVPKKAMAKLDFRLVPNQDPLKILELVKKHLQTHGFEDVQVTLNASVDPFRTDVTDSFVQLNQTVASQVYGDKVTLIPNTAGGGPASPFYDVLNDPVVMVGVHYAGSGPHAPNEHIREKDLVQGSVFLTLLLDEYSKS